MYKKPKWDFLLSLKIGSTFHKWASILIMCLSVPAWPQTPLKWVCSYLLHIRMSFFDSSLQRECIFNIKMSLGPHVCQTLLRFTLLSTGGAARLLRWWGNVGISSGSQAAWKQQQDMINHLRDYLREAIPAGANKGNTHEEVSLWSRSSLNNLWR